MVAGKKFIFRRTILDIPLIVFLISQILSTITSIDFRTSLLGYYSRFNGGFLSSLSYTLLYWAFVSNMDAKKTKKALYFLLGSGVLVCLYGVLEHFGIDKNLWVQDVQNRVFSTLGQPNWLAAWIAALIPLIWNLQINKSTNLQIKSKVFWLWLSVSTLFFLTLLYTKSRSGILGFATGWIIFWGITIFKSFKKNLLDRELVSKFLILNFALLILAGATGTPWTPTFANFIKTKTLIINIPTRPSAGPALEVGGTESGTIRKIVWKGAIEIWKHYPVLGTGVETFAYSYYNFRPVEHNLVSEWDFLYNKAHNEYLNFMANTGTVGIVSYLILIVSTLYLFWRGKAYAFGAGYVSILVSNFFGFSVVPVNLEFFLFPAIAIALANNQQTTSNIQLKKLASGQKAAIVILLLVGSWLLIVISRYWYADFLYAKGKLYDDSSQFAQGAQYLMRAEKLSPNEAIFHNEISSSYSSIAVTLAQDHQKDKAQQFADAAIIESDGAVKLSPANVNLRRSRVSMFIKLAIINPSYLNDALAVLLDAIKLAPTDAKLYYNLGLIYSRLGQNDEALQTLEHTVDIKANYKEARLALAILLNDRGDKKEARAQLEYILKYIDPNDSITKQQLEEVGK